jgi:ubiquinone/menaquinone biosynthesis C-methylase UbiE
VRFDGQASEYEERVGLPYEISREIAAQLVEGLPANALVVDVGAGTGVVGRELLGRVRYLGIDVSRPMLLEFPEAKGRLLQADADAAWPIADHSANLILFSRSAHLLKQTDRTLAEVLRIAAPGCRVYVGRVRRPRESAGEQLKRMMQDLLRARNLPGKNGERAKRDFLEALPGQPLPMRQSREWSEEAAPIDSLASWRGKDGIGGRTLSREAQSEILDELERWAMTQFGDLTVKRSIPQHYELEGVQLV